MHLVNGFYGGLGASAVAAYITAIVISGMKGKPFMVIMGVIGLGIPAISPWPVIGAIRIAKPDSQWARKYYGDEKMKIANARFPKKNPK